jgi:sugar lactone lactonase YvrE
MTNDHPPLRRRLLSVAATVLAVTLPAVLLAPSAIAKPPKPPKPHFPAVMALPNGWLPEGIATVGHTAYLGSRADGDIYRLDLRTGQGSVISQGPGTPSVGVKAGHGLLWVAGGPSGSGRVVNLATGAIAASLPFTTNPSFVNDVLLTRGAAWFTDSLQPQLYRVSLDDWSVTTLPLSGEWVQNAGNNANGISTTPDGRALLVINSSNGTLYRVDPASGEATTVDSDVPLTAGDGLLREGRTLYVVQNRLNTIAVLRLGKHGTSAELADTITSPNFDVPTTVARWGDRLYLPNARFTTPPTPDTTYSVVQVPISRAGGPGPGGPAGP